MEIVKNQNIDFELKEMKNYLDFPDWIQDSETRLKELEEKNIAVESQIEVIKNIKYGDVFSELAEDGKKKFTNDDMRSAETRKRLNNYEPFILLDKQRIDLNNQIKTEKIKFNLLNNKLRVYSNLMNYLASRRT